MKHYCKGQGCTSNLTFAVLHYSTKHADSIDLELEVDPLNVDHFSCTPLVSNQYLLMHVSDLFNPCMCVFDICLPLTSTDVGMCSGSYWGSIGAIPVGPKSSCYSRFTWTPPAEHRPIPGPHPIGWALRAAATESSNSGPACRCLDREMERGVTNQRHKQQPHPEPKLRCKPILCYFVVYCFSYV